MENISKEKIEELKKIEEKKILDINLKINDISEQESKMTSLKSQLFVEKIKTEGSIKAFKNLLNLLGKEKEEKVEQKEGL